jgi:hypothetical protein
MAASIAVPPLIAADSHGGVAYSRVLETDDTVGVEVGLVNHRGAHQWRRTLPFSQAEASAMCVDPEGGIFVAGWSDQLRDDYMFLTEIDDTGQLSWQQRFPSEHAQLTQLVVTRDSIFVMAAVSHKVDFGGGALLNPAGAGQGIPQRGALAIAAFDRSGVHRWSWISVAARPGEAVGAGDLLVATLGVDSRFQIPRGPELNPGTHVVALGSSGEAVWDRPYASDVSVEMLGTSSEVVHLLLHRHGQVPGRETYPVPLESRWLADLGRDGSELRRRQIWQRDLGWLLREAQQPEAPLQPAASPIVRCTGGGVANVRGERLIVTNTPTEPTGAPYALLNAAGDKLWKRRPLHASAHVELSLGDDGSVFEAAAYRPEGSGPDSVNVYVARVQ